MKKYQYLRRVYDNESTLDFDLAKLGAAGWLMCGVVRWNPSPARISYMVWYAREMRNSGPREKIPEKSSTMESSTRPFQFTSPGSAPPVIGPMIPRVEGDPLGSPTYWPDFNLEENPFDDSEIELPDDDKD